MPDNIVDRLVETFRRFPGTGPRQARRFVYHLLHEGRGSIDYLVTQLRELTSVVAQCGQCYRFYSSNGQTVTRVCNLCADQDRDSSLLMIVEKDADLEAIKQSGTYAGHFFVLGGLIPILEKDPKSKVRLNELLTVIARRIKMDQLKEIIVALAVNPEGDHTVESLKQELASFVGDKDLKLTVLGRGLSTGTELEYSDAETIKSALANRS